MKVFLASSYPGLYQSANECSLNAQRTYLCVFQWNLIFLISGTAFAAVDGQDTASAMIAAALFLSSLFLSILLAYKKYESTWYNGRAVAESVKTRSWRFMMRADPYQGDHHVEVRKRFLSDLQLILEQNRQLAEHMTSRADAGEGISDNMLSIQAAELRERVEWYTDARIKDQWQWYASKAAFNRRRASQSFLLLCIFQGAALVFVLSRIAFPQFLCFPAEVCAVIAGAVISWMQVRRYQDLSASYSLAAHEIGIIKSQIIDVDSEGRFSSFVLDAENAFSREHIQWQARRNE